MPQDFVFDPVTRDIVDDGAGSWEMTDTAGTMVQHQTWCHAFAWWGLSNLGSRLHDLRPFQANPALLIPAEWERSLGVIVARGRISNVNVAVDPPKPGRIVGKATMRDVGTGQTIAAYVTPGGK